MNKIGFIGIGNMGGAMVKSIAYNKENFIYIYDSNQQMYEHFEQVNVMKSTSIEALVEACQYIVLTIKPQYYLEVIESIRPHLLSHHIIVTVAPGITIDQMKAWLGDTTKIIRTMPNTPALIGSGVTAYCYEKHTISTEELEGLVRYLNCFGKSYEVLESQMEAVVAVSGSSPAYGYMFIEAMGDAAVRFGLPRVLAYEMAALSIKGACEMILETNEHPGALKDAVTSPGGTTIEAVATLEAEGFRNAVIKAMSACCQKAKEMREK